jgi:hypothetical protein
LSEETRQSLQRVNLQNTKKKKLREHRPFEAWFSSYGLLKIKENAPSVDLELQSKMLHACTLIS